MDGKVDAVAWMCEWTDPEDGEPVRLSFDWKAGAESRAQEVGGDARVTPLYPQSAINDLMREVIRLTERLEVQTENAVMLLTRAERAEADAVRLRSALGRTLTNFKGLLARTPVRDACETIAEAESAMQGEGK